MEYASEDNLPAYWGVWVYTGPSLASGTFAVEPTTGRYDQIDRAIKDNSAGRVAPFGRRRMVGALESGLILKPLPKENKIFSRLFRTTKMRESVISRLRAIHSRHRCKLR